MTSDKQRVYYNATINNTGAIPKTAEYSDYRQYPLFPGPPRDYTAALLKLKIPSTFIPIQYFPVQFDVSNPSNLDKSTYSITLEYQGNIFRQFLEWQTQQEPPFIRTPKPPPVEPTNKKSDVLALLYYALYSYTHFCTILNRALKQCFETNIVPLLPLRPEPYIAPYFVYSHTIRRFNYFVDPIFLYNNNDPNRVKMWFNSPLNSNFTSSFDVHYKSFNAPDGRDTLYIPTGTNFKIKNVSGVDVGLYEQSQEYNTDNSFSDLKSIIIRSDSITIENEAVSLGEDTFNSTSISAIGDYFLDLNLDLSNARENIFIDNANGEFQRITLRGSLPLTNIKLTVLWRDRYDNVFPVLIESNTSVFIKLLFEEK
jgi:hypothetical protein